MSTSKERFYLWDNLKFFLIACVVLGHFVDLYVKQSTVFRSIFLCVSTFHLPLFIYIQGLFAKSFARKSASDSWPKLIYFLLLYLLLKMLGFFAIYAVDGTPDKLTFFNDRGVQWYMFASFLFLLSSRFFIRIKPGFALSLAVFLALLSGYDPSIGTWYSLARYFNFLPFFLLGLYMDPVNIARTLKKPVFRVLSVGILAIFLFLCFFRLDTVYWIRPMLTGANSYQVLKQPILGGIVRFCYYIGVLLVGAAIISLMPQKKLPILSLLGERTLQIYFWHRPILTLLNVWTPMLQQISPHYWVILFIIESVLLTFVLGVSVFGKPLTMLDKACRNAFQEKTNF